METQRITATSMNRAMLKAKKMFKDDAVILESKSIELDGKTYYEILVSGTRAEQEKPKERNFARENANRVLDIINKVNQNSQKNLQQSKTVNFSSVSNLKFFLGEEYEIISSLNQEEIKLYKKLTSSGITKDIAASITKEIFESGFENQTEMKFLLEKILYDNLNVSGNLYEKNYDRRIISLIGTSGVGKTTTIAKMVSEALISYNKKVALFTFDNFKKSTLLQLKVHANILKVPFETVKSERDFINKLIKYNNYDLILLDMEGVNIFDDDELKQLSDLLKNIPNLEKHLTIPVTASEYNQEIIYKKFKKLNPNYLLYTRLDETDNYTSILNLNLKTDLPLSYITTGPHISGDLFLADKRKLARLISNQI